MTLEELRASYTAAYRIIARERAKASGDYAGELEKLLVILDDMKDFCKQHILAQPEQPTLLDVVRKATYP